MENIDNDNTITLDSDDEIETVQDDIILPIGFHWLGDKPNIIRKNSLDKTSPISHS